MSKVDTLSKLCFPAVFFQNTQITTDRMAEIERKWDLITKTQ